jgi:hypothetical protein
MHLRIRGLVKTMNLVRQRLAVGLDPEEADQLRVLVVRTLRSVEAACRSYRTRPEALPTPSLRAYRYLESLDLQALPMRDPEQPPPEPRSMQVRIKNLINACDRIHHKMELLVTGKQSVEDLSQDEIAALRSAIRNHVERVEVLCREQGGAPMQMPQRSRRAFLWLHLLQDHELLVQHLMALAQAGTAAATFTSGQSRGMTASVRFFNISHLYRSAPRHGCFQVTINEGFIGAPAEVIKALVHAALGDRSPDHLQRLRSYADSKNFARFALALSDDDHEQSARGHHHDLAESFARVNQAYFGGQLSSPRLTWSKTLTRRKLGHYRPSTDTVMISQTVDSPAAPDYVVDFLMYHELLHRVLGIREVNGRRRIHTPKFRAKEKRFKQYEQAEAALQKLTEL